MIAIKTEKEKTEFEKLMEKADEAYKKEEYRWASGLAVRASRMASGKNQKAMADNKIGWTSRFAGLKSISPADRKEYYNLARAAWENVLILNPDDVDMVISAIKGLILLPTETEKTVSIVELEGLTFILNKEIVELYLLGEKEIKKRVVNHEESNHLLATLLNSMGIVVRGYDIETAAKIFEAGYLKVKPETTEAGHLYHGKGTCYLMLKNEDKDKLKKRIYAKIALIYLEWALDHYPKDAKDRKTVQDKIDNTQAEIKNNFE